MFHREISLEDRLDSFQAQIFQTVSTQTAIVPGILQYRLAELSD